jgi:hypothetical protein
MTNQIFCIWQIPEKKRVHNVTVHQLFIDVKKACDSVRTEVLYNILIEFRTPRKLVHMCLSQTYSTVCIGKRQCDNFPIQNGLQQGVGDAFSPLLFKLSFGIRH